MAAKLKSMAGRESWILKTVLIVFLLPVTLLSQDYLPKVVSGKIERIANFQSRYVTARNVDVWLPEGYSDKTKYAVLYMQDGQMLFDPEYSWNKQAWDVDDVASELLTAGKVGNFIVVGIWNSGQNRHPDYFPQKPFEQLTQTEKDTVTAQLQRAGRTDKAFLARSDDYLRFVVEELKPHIDKTYSVHTDREHTYIAGSSMGGLVSMYAICEYPEIFGAAACLSTHWPGTFTMEHNRVPDAFIRYLEENLPNPEDHRIYFDCGDQTLDAFYPDIQKRVDRVMAAMGYTDKNWTTHYFPGENHSEAAWNKRLHVPLEFLLGK